MNAARQALRYSRLEEVLYRTRGTTPPVIFACVAELVQTPLECGGQCVRRHFGLASHTSQQQSIPINAIRYLVTFNDVERSYT